jgi:hypothetical protein
MMTADRCRLVDFEQLVILLTLPLRCCGSIGDLLGLARLRRRARNMETLMFRRDATERGESRRLRASNVARTML